MSLASEDMISCIFELTSRTTAMSATPLSILLILWTLSSSSSLAQTKSGIDSRVIKLQKSPMQPSKAETA